MAMTRPNAKDDLNTRYEKALLKAERFAAEMTYYGWDAKALLETLITRGVLTHECGPKEG